jgi:hypothetical protein
MAPAGADAAVPERVHLSARLSEFAAPTSAQAAGCSAAWQRASFGTKRPPVQIRPPRPGHTRRGSFQGLRRPVIVDGHAAHYQVLPFQTTKPLRSNNRLANAVTVPFALPCHGGNLPDAARVQLSCLRNPGNVPLMSSWALMRAMAWFSAHNPDPREPGPARPVPPHLFRHPRGHSGPAGPTSAHARTRVARIVGANGDVHPVTATAYHR